MFGSNSSIIKKKKKKDKRETFQKITLILESQLIEYGIDRSKYHGGDLKGISIVRMLKIQMKYMTNSKFVLQNP